MKTSEYSYRNSGMPATANEEWYAFANERFTDRLVQAEAARSFKVEAQQGAAQPVKVIWQWAVTVLTWILY